MNHTIVIPANTLNKILKTLLDLKRDMARLTERIESSEPTYGSDEWWEWSNKKAMEDIKAGRYTTIHNKKELNEFFDSLKST